MGTMYKSKFKKLTPIPLPPFSNTRVLMMPFRMDDITTLPNALVHYTKTVGHGDLVRKKLF